MLKYYHVVGEPFLTNTYAGIFLFHYTNKCHLKMWDSSVFYNYDTLFFFKTYEFATHVDYFTKMFL